MKNRVYECALTGLTEDAAYPSSSDGLEDLPVGWTKITMTRRQYNSKWLAIQQVKDATVEALLQQFPEEIREVQRFVVQIQVEAQMKALESDTPMYLTDVEDVVYVSDSGEVLSALNELRQNLGLEELPEEEDEAEEAEEETP
jgi:hypothetical protein